MPGAKKRVKEATGTPSVAAAAAATTDQPASTPRGPSSSPSSSPFRFPISSTVRKRAHVLSVDVGGGDTVLIAFLTSHANQLSFYKLNSSLQVGKENKKVLKLETGQSIIDVAVVRINVKGKDRDALVLHTEDAKIILYDPLKQKYISTWDCPQNATGVTVGYFGKGSSPMVLMSTEYHIYGYRLNGECIFWSLAGDCVSSQILLHKMESEDGQIHMIVASEDHCIRKYDWDDCKVEYQERNIPKILRSLQVGCFGFALNNGDFGVYSLDKRLWKLNIKKQVSCLFSIDKYDLIFIGFEDGAMQIRSSLNGFLVNEDISSCGGTDVNIVDIGKADFGSSNVSMILIFRSNGFVDMMNWSTQDYSQYETKQIINPSMSVTSSPASIVVNQLHGADTATLSPTTATQKDVQKTAETVPVSKTSSIVSKSSNVMTVKSDMNSKSLSAKTLDPILLQQQQQQLEKQQQIPLYEEEIIDGVLNDLHQIVDVEKTLEKVEVQTTSTVSKSISSSLKAKFQLQQPAVLSSAAMMEHQSIELEIAYSAHLNSYLPTITVTAPKGQKLTSVHIHGYHGSLAKDEIDGQITEAVGQVSVPLELKQLNIEDNLEVIMQLQGSQATVQRSILFPRYSAYSLFELPSQSSAKPRYSINSTSPEDAADYLVEFSIIPGLLSDVLPKLKKWLATNFIIPKERKESLESQLNVSIDQSQSPSQTIFSLHARGYLDQTDFMIDIMVGKVSIQTTSIDLVVILFNDLCGQVFNKQPDIDGHLCSNPIKQPTGVDIHKLPLKPQHLLHSKKLKEVIGNFTHLQMLKDQSNSLINPKLVLVQKRLESASKLMGMKFFGRSANEFGKIRDLNSSILEELLLWSEQAGQFDEIVSSIKGLVDLFGTVKRGSPKQDFISRSKDLMDKADLEKLKELLLINLKAIKI